MHQKECTYNNAPINGKPHFPSSTGIGGETFPQKQEILFAHAFAQEDLTSRVAPRCGAVKVCMFQIPAYARTGGGNRGGFRGWF